MRNSATTQCALVLPNRLSHYLRNLGWTILQLAKSAPSLPSKLESYRGIAWSDPWLIN